MGQAVDLEVRSTPRAITTHFRQNVAGPLDALSRAALSRLLVELRDLSERAELGGSSSTGLGIFPSAPLRKRDLVRTMFAGLGTSASAPVIFSGQADSLLEEVEESEEEEGMLVAAFLML
eukprot:4974271-Amphidinium_carterae.1